MVNSRAGENFVGVGCGFTVVDCEDTIENVDAATTAAKSVEVNMANRRVKVRRYGC